MRNHLHRTRRAIAVLAMAALVGSAAAVVGTSPAQAATPGGTIAFVKNYNVWLVRADGSALTQITRDGTFASPYMSPSMSDAGVIAVGKGQEIVRMQQSGKVLNRINPGPLNNSAGQPVDGPPIHVAISPNGQSIAYTMVNYTCPIGVSCGARPVTGVTDAAALSPNRIKKNYYSEPSWVTNTRLMTHGGYLSHMMLQDLGGDYEHWFDDSDVMYESTDLGDAAVSRDGTRWAGVRGYNETTHLVTGRVTSNVRTGSISSLTPATYDCATTTDAAITNPSWGPDNKSVVFTDSDGLVVMTTGATCAGNTFRVIAPGGTEPFWSPAALSSDAGTFRPAETKPAKVLKKFKVKTKPKIKKGKKVVKKAEVGARLKATRGKWSKAPRKVTFRWMRGAKIIKGKAGAKAAYRVKRADRGKKLSVKVTVKRPGFAKKTVRTKPVRIRR